MRKQLKISKTLIHKILFNSILCCLLLTSACYENIEGCLELEATNFDVSADKACENCCQFPKLRLNILHRIKDPVRDTFYNFPLNAKVNPDVPPFFYVNDLRYYLSDIQLIRSDGSLLSVEDEIRVTQFNSNGDSTSVIIPNNFALINRRTPTTTSIGTLRAKGNFTGLQFKLGIPAEINQSEPSSFPSNHPLAYRDSTMYFSRDSGYVFYRIQLFRDTSAVMPVLLKTGTNAQLRQIIVNFPFELKVGFNTILTLRVDYGEWFKQIELETDTPNDMIAKIVEGLVQSFELISVDYSLQ
ncbi:MAG: hypothetical protein HC892_09335 [Saprospiraceae bacterium]|nr:hypothetical protein [Saprospiraceae bacterium]